MAITKILIVDDFQYVIELLKRWIAKLWPVGVSFELVTAVCSSADLAIEVVKDYQPDVLFLDYSFGSRSSGTGQNVALWIDHNYQKPICVATHTSYPEAKAREFFAPARCVTHYVNPASPESISDFIGHCIAGKKEGNDAAT
ncbi:MAG: hypothetical protein HYS78_02525 [Parcubacteria group bacterium]|nr:hypothetical protein [Parcubacteria group bacterium]